MRIGIFVCRGGVIVKAIGNIFVVLFFIFNIPVFHYSPTADFAEEYFGVEACVNDAFGEANALPGQKAVFFAHGGGLNKCGCHFNRKTGECHCHQDRGCGCECQPSSCN